MGNGICTRAQAKVKAEAAHTDAAVLQAMVGAGVSTKGADAMAGLATQWDALVVS